ncbi:MAG: DUF58 domain-containing protein [Candidatus Cyclobacteriaceae bacterium M3_2C_046]
MIGLYQSLYLNHRLFQIIAGIVILFVLSFFFPFLLSFSIMGFFILLGLLIVDLLLLYLTRQGILANRIVAAKLSNGDENPVQIYLENHYAFKVHLKVIDEIPFQFQKRDILFDLLVGSGKTHVIHYNLKPKKRGIYNFGAVNVYVKHKLGLVSRRYKFQQDLELPVYPAFLQMKKYEIYAISNQLAEHGLKKIRRIGHQMEFDQIKEYVAGDDYRTINWKATARKSELMVNVYQDEKSQQVFSLIDKGRVMKMPFEGMTLLDYAINASLVISNIAVLKDDKAGLITFQDQVETILPASRRKYQMQLIMDNLYHQTTGFKESDLSLLYSQINRKIRQRSLLLLFTNFESLSALERQLPFLKNMARLHLLVCIFFKNTELNQLLDHPADSVEEIYHQTLAEKFAYEKKLIVKELGRQGIQAILTEPQQLTVNTINKYLELKARGLI